MFEEQQSFVANKWVRLVTIVIVLLTTLGLILRINDSPQSEIRIGITLLIATVGIALAAVFSITMTTRVNSEGIHILLSPLFIQRKLKWADVTSWEVRKFFKEQELGNATGPGVVSGVKATGYIIKGDSALVIHTMPGRRFLIGTQKPKSIQQFIQKLNPI